MRTLIKKDRNYILSIWGRQKMIRTMESNQIIDFTHVLNELSLHLFDDFIRHFVFGHLKMEATDNLTFSVRKITPNVGKLLWAVIFFTLMRYTSLHGDNCERCRIFWILDLPTNFLSRNRSHIIIINIVKW